MVGQDGSDEGVVAGAAVILARPQLA